MDFWALGCILFEFLVGLPPFSSNTVEEVFEKIVPLPGDAGIAEHFRIPNAPKPVKFAVSAGGAKLGGDVASPAHPSDFTITFTQPPAAPPAHP